MHAKAFGSPDQKFESLQQILRCRSLCRSVHININMSVSQINKALPTLPAGWSADKDFKAVGKLSAAARRNVEPVGPYFLAHARRVRLTLLYDYRRL